MQHEIEWTAPLLQLLLVTFKWISMHFSTQPAYWSNGHMINLSIVQRMQW